MKRFAILGLAALMVVAFTVPASAMESIFGGYWRTRGFTQQDFSGDESESENRTQVDTRARLYYTAVLNDNLKFVNKFEMDAVWGSTGSESPGGYNADGDIGTDGVGFEIKNSYVDFTLGGESVNMNGKVGLQGVKLGRGFLFDDDFAGIILSFNAVGDSAGFTLPIMWMRAYENRSYEDEVDYFAVAPSFNIADNMRLTPFGMYVYSNDARRWSSTSAYDELNLYYAGADLDINLGPLSVWATGIYQGGEADLAADTTQSIDFEAYLGAAGLGLDFGVAELHGQAFYATGEDTEEEEAETFFVPKGQSYYWAEIMGYGIFDDKGISAYHDGNGDQIGNIMAANVGLTFKPVSDLSITLDGWYAALAEDVVINGEEENELGIEADMVITYQLVEGLKLDLVGAYLFAGDVVTLGRDNDKNPYEIGTRLSLSF